MSLTWQNTNDGYFVTNERGQAICHVHTKRTIQVQETQKPDNRKVWLEQVEAIPHEHWQVHFVGRKLSVAEVAAVSAEMPQE